jgi:biotin carboxylase
VRELAARGAIIGAVACYDCESLLPAAHLAAGLGHPFASPHSVIACRSKLESKRLWREAGIECPEAGLVRSLDEALSFLQRMGRPIVMKPLCGSGSELTFFCRTEAETAGAFGVLSRRLRDHPRRRLYGEPEVSGLPEDPRTAFVAEEFVRGREYGADFALRGGGLRVLRVTRKLSHPTAGFGTTMAYVMPADLSPGFLEELHTSLARAAEILGLDNALCMADFVVRDGRAVLLEMTPRPGGDCLPDLLRHSGQWDTIGAELDLAEGRALAPREAGEWRPTVAVRLFATSPGVVRRIDTAPLAAYPGVVGTYLRHGPGHRVVLPPEDYESRILGHVVFEPAGAEPLRAQCSRVAALVRLDIEADTCRASMSC